MVGFDVDVGAVMVVYVAVVGGVCIEVSGRDCQTHSGVAQHEQLARGSMTSMAVGSTHI